MKNIYQILALVLFIFGSFKPAVIERRMDSLLKGYIPKAGDIVFQTLPENKLVEAINGVTNSNYTHCGIVFKDTNEKWMVVESYGAVIKVSLEQWIQRGVNQGFAVYRLKTQYKPSIPSFVDSAKAMLWLPYDYHFSLNNQALYCSELVYKAFASSTGDILGKLEKLGDMNWKPHEAFIRKVEHGKLPLEREIISPVAISEDEKLNLIIRYKI